MADKNQPRQPVAITADAMRDAIRDGDDFGFEVRVRALLEENGGAVAHGWSYVDPALGKTRQFDLRWAFKHYQWPRQFLFAIECKNLLADSPLVISGVRRATTESFHDVVASGSMGAFMRVTNRGVYRAAIENVVYPEGGFVGKNLLRLQRSKDEQRLVPSRDKESEVYDKWTQAVASSYELCRRAITAGVAEQNPLLTVVLPGIVVPDGTLWTLQYDAQGQWEAGPALADSAELFLNHKFEIETNNYWMVLSHVHFWTVSGLRRFLANLGDPRNSWNTWFPNKLEPYRPRSDG